jgi:hypothetical protein
VDGPRQSGRALIDDVSEAQRLGDEGPEQAREQADGPHHRVRALATDAGEAQPLAEDEGDRRPTVVMTTPVR